MELDERTVTVRADDVPLLRVLEEISRLSGLRVEADGQLDQSASLSFERLPLREALDRLLENHSYLLRLVDPDSGAGTHSSLWVFATTSGKIVSPAAASSEDAGEAVEAAEVALLESLALALVDEVPRVRLRAVAGLSELGGQEAAATLTTVALADADPSVREEAVYALGEIGALGETGATAAKLGLEQALVDPHPRVREAALGAFTDIGGDDSAWSIAFVLTDEDASLREEAVYALGEIGGKAAVTLLQQALSDEHSLVWEAAAELLEELSQHRR